MKKLLIYFEEERVPPVFSRRTPESISDSREGGFIKPTLFAAGLYNMKHHRVRTQYRQFDALILLARKNYIQMTN